jgi:hypothetical protein
MDKEDIMEKEGIMEEICKLANELTKTTEKEKIVDLVNKIYHLKCKLVYKPRPKSYNDEILWGC